MTENRVLLKRKASLTGLVIGLLFGCIVGCIIGSNLSSSNDSVPTIASSNTPVQKQTEVITNSPKQTSTISQASEITSTSSITLTPTITTTPLPTIVNIPSTTCGDHMAYSANANVTKIPIIENDKIIEHANYILITYKIKNTYVNTPIYGFEVQPSPGYENPDLYPYKSPMFTSDPLIQPNEEVILKSEHIFMPKNWDRSKYPSAFLKFPENIYPPYRYGDAKVGNKITFAIVELLDIFSDNNGRVRCNGIFRIE